MEIYLDTAQVDEIAKGVETGCIRGVTTNPTIVSRAHKPLRQCIADIVAIDPELTVLIEAVSATSKELIDEGQRLAELAPNAVIKLPMTQHGLAAARGLALAGVSTTLTLVFSLNQAIAACCAGADYVAPFVGRLDDINADGLALVSSIKHTFRLHEANVRVIAASVRTCQSVAQLFEAGCDIVTMPYSVFSKMLLHPLTDAGLKQFEADWKTVPEGAAPALVK